MIDLSVSDVTFRKFVEFSFLSPIPANKNPVTVSSSPIIPINLLFSLRLNLLFFDFFFFIYLIFFIYFIFLFIFYLLFICFILENFNNMLLLKFNKIPIQIK